MNQQEELAIDAMKAINSAFAEAFWRAVCSGGEEGLDFDSKIARIYKYLDEAIELEAARRHISSETVIALWWFARTNNLL
jgi:hypothetical protein